MCLDRLSTVYMPGKKCQSPFECENVRTLSSKSGCSNIIIFIISLLTSHRLLSCTDCRRCRLFGFRSQSSSLSIVTPRAVCLLVLYVCSRSFPPFFLIVLFCLIATEWRRVVLVVVAHAFIVVLFFSLNMMCNISKPSECFFFFFYFYSFIDVCVYVCFILILENVNLFDV